MIELELNNRRITTKLPAFVMGIVNANNDSFWEKSRGNAEKAFTLIEEGADIIDVGGESTRPGSEYVPEDEEIRRVVPVIEEIRKKSDIAISVDTRKTNVMKAAFEAGADILNDISALEDDPEMADFCASVKIPVILMHKRGIPSEMQKNTNYSNVFEEVNNYLLARAAFAESKGILSDKIIVDPGVGFGKDLNGNISLIKNIGNLCGKRYKILMALSRKTCIGQMTGRDIPDRLAGTLAADLISVMKGASLVRVHDVKETVDTLKVLNYINKYSLNVEF